MSSIQLRSLTYIIIIGLGFFLSKVKIFNTNTRDVLSRVSLYVALPAALISSFDTFKFELDYLAIVIFGFIVNIALIIFTILIKHKEDRLTQATYFLNTSSFNIGSFAIPFALGAFSNQLIIVLIMFDIGNGLFSLGINNAIAHSYVYHEATDLVKKTIKRLVSSPPLVTYIVMLFLQLFPFKLSGEIFDITKSIGSSNVFIVMLMFGVMIGTLQDGVKLLNKESLSIVAIRYSLCGLMSLVVWYFLPFSTLYKQLLVFALLSPMSSLIPVFCMGLKADSKKYSSVVTISIILSILILTVLLSVWNF